MSCNRCARQAEAAMGAAGVPARQTQAAWLRPEALPEGASDAGQPGRCDRCGAFLARQGQCNRPGCGALSPLGRADSTEDSTELCRSLVAGSGRSQAVVQQLESVGVPDQQARAIAASREKPGSKGKKT